MTLIPKGTVPLLLPLPVLADAAYPGGRQEYASRASLLSDSRLCPSATDRSVILYHKDGQKSMTGWTPSKNWKRLLALDAQARPSVLAAMNRASWPLMASHGLSNVFLHESAADRPGGQHMRNSSI